MTDASASSVLTAALHTPPAGNRCAVVLNALALGERRGARILSAWSDATADPGLARLLADTAIRQLAHGAAFEKRCSELGATPRETPCTEFDRFLAVACSAAPDTEKFECLFEFSEDSATTADPLARLFDDGDLDPVTGALLGRFIAECRDSERRLRQAYTRLTGRDS